MLVSNQSQREHHYVEIFLYVYLKFRIKYITCVLTTALGLDSPHPTPPRSSQTMTWSITAMMVSVSQTEKKTSQPWSGPLGCLECFQTSWTSRVCTMNKFITLGPEDTMRFSITQISTLAGRTDMGSLIPMEMLRPHWSLHEAQADGGSVAESVLGPVVGASPQIILPLLSPHFGSLGKSPSSL